MYKTYYSFPYRELFLKESMKEILKNYGQNNETYIEHNLEEYVL